MDNTYMPQWNEEIHLPVQLPSMCDRVRVQIWDSDTPSAVANRRSDAFRVADDVIATHFLNLAQISATSINSGTADEWTGRG